MATGKTEGDAKPELCIDVATGRTAGIGGIGEGTYGGEVTITSTNTVIVG